MFRYIEAWDGDKEIFTSPKTELDSSFSYEGENNYSFI